MTPSELIYRARLECFLAAPYGFEAWAEQYNDLADTWPLLLEWDISRAHWVVWAACVVSQIKGEDPARKMAAVLLGGTVCPDGSRMRDSRHPFVREALDIVQGGAGQATRNDMHRRLRESLGRLDPSTDKHMVSCRTHLALMDMLGADTWAAAELSVKVAVGLTGDKKALRMPAFEKALTSQVDALKTIGNPFKKGIKCE